MIDAKRTVKQRRSRGMEYLFLSFYLGFVLSLSAVY